MHLWYSRKWENYIDLNADGHKSGLYLHFEKGIDKQVRTFWRPEGFATKPYARIAAGDYQELVMKRGKEEAMWAILLTFALSLI